MTFLGHQGLVRQAAAIWATKSIRQKARWDPAAREHRSVVAEAILTAFDDLERKIEIIYAKRRTALKRYGDPEEVAHMTLSLVLPAASYITGAVIPVDGGLIARNA